MTTYEINYPPHSPPYPPLGLTVQTLPTGGVSIFSPNPQSPHMSVGDLIVSVNGCELPPHFTVPEFAFLITALRDKREPITLELQKPGEAGMDDVMGPFIKSSIHVMLAKLIKKTTANYTDTNGLQAPFCLAAAKAAMKSYELAQVGVEEPWNPFLNSINAILFADSTIQNVTDLPSPWALEMSTGIQEGMNMKDQQENGMNSFALAAISSALGSPGALLDEPEQPGSRKTIVNSKEEMDKEVYEKGMAMALKYIEEHVEKEVEGEKKRMEEERKEMEEDRKKLEEQIEVVRLMEEKLTPKTPKTPLQPTAVPKHPQTHEPKFIPGRRSSSSGGRSSSSSNPSWKCGVCTCINKGKPNSTLKCGACYMPYGKWMCVQRTCNLINDSEGRFCVGCGTSKDKGTGDGAPFIKSDTFMGPKMGYVFKKGRYGVGYYKPEESSKASGYAGAVRNY
ncbi:hypothetical protein TrLO_g8764 [Triparma laevis f. longispina]|nr:hypothetical protein TrLO_g8764 [Triparma laevis f. longispina]